MDDLDRKIKALEAEQDELCKKRAAGKVSSRDFETRTLSLQERLKGLRAEKGGGCLAMLVILLLLVLMFFISPGIAIVSALFGGKFSIAEMWTGSILAAALVYGGLVAVFRKDFKAAGFAYLGLCILTTAIYAVALLGFGARFPGRHWDYLFNGPDSRSRAEMARDAVRSQYESLDGTRPAGAGRQPPRQGSGGQASASGAEAKRAVREWTAVLDDKALAKEQKSGRIAALESGGLGLDLVRQAADRGDGAAEYVVGSCYAQGIRVDQDEALGNDWLLKSAGHGHARAQFMVGMLKEDGSGLEWIRKAAEQGHVPAQETMGTRLLLGKGIAQDPAQAAVWLRKAADQGSLSAKTMLGGCYYKGVGVPVDEQRGLALIREAAAQGDATAKSFLTKIEALVQAKAEQAAKEQAEREAQERREMLLASLSKTMRERILNSFRTKNSKGQRLFKQFKENTPELTDATPEQRQQAWLLFVAEACDTNRDGRLDTRELDAPL